MIYTICVRVKLTGLFLLPQHHGTVRQLEWQQTFTMIKHVLFIQGGVGKEDHEGDAKPVISCRFSAELFIFCSFR